MISPFDLTGKQIIITGASSGIGRATSIVLSNFSAKIVLVGRDKNRLEQTQKKLNGNGHAIYSHDLADLETIAELSKNISAECGKISGLIHCAGISDSLPLKVQECKDIERMMKINLLAGLELTKQFSRKGRFRDDGFSIIFISSIAAIKGEKALSAYSASKGAIISAARSIALELADKKIRVNVISPGYVDTEMLTKTKLSEKEKQRIVDNHPLGIGRPEDIAYASLFLLAESGRWITGTNLIVDGGYTI